MTAATAVLILASFVVLDLFKYWVSEVLGTGEAWLLQDDIKALRHSIASATSPRSLEYNRARERMLRDKEAKLLRIQTPSLRRALFCSHYLSLVKGLAGVVVTFHLWGQPLFSVQRVSVWPLGRWLAAPHGKQWEVGTVAVLPFIALAGAASEALCSGLLGPLSLWTLQRLGCKVNRKGTNVLRSPGLLKKSGGGCQAAAGVEVGPEAGPGGSRGKKCN